MVDDRRVRYSDDAYVRLVARDRLRASDQSLLRSLLGAENEQ